MELTQEIIKKAQNKSITFTFAESCTGGLCASSITDISGSSEVFKGSIVSYSDEIKHKIIAVSLETLKRFGAVSEETAKEMAQGALNTFTADIALSLTGVAGPLGGNEKNPVGSVWIGLANSKGKNIASKFVVEGDRIENKKQFCKIALEILLTEINQF